MKRSKKTMQKKHTKRRAVERFGLHLRPDAYEELRLMVRKPEKGKSVFLRRQSNRVTLWALFYQGRWLPIVYDSSRKSIATILPEHTLLPYASMLGLMPSSLTSECQPLMEE